MEYTVRGERTSISKESIIMNVKDGLSPIIKLKGKQVVRISSQENFTEPGFSLVNANDMEDSLIVERIVPQDYDSQGLSIFNICLPIQIFLNQSPAEQLGSTMSFLSK